MRIYLTGFMGSGKTHVGKRLAHLMQIPFVDLDTQIVAAAGQAISSIFLEKGEAFFRKLEQSQLHATASHTTAVISTGGGTPCYFDNMDWINQQGVSVYLQTSPIVLFQRLEKEAAHRPVLEGLEGDALLSHIRNKLSERKAFYEQAKVIFPVEASTVPVAEPLLAILQKQN